MQRWFLLGVFIFALLPHAGQVKAQSPITISDVKVDYAFGDRITFTATVNSSIAVNEADLLFQVEGEATTRTDPVEVAQDGEIKYIYLMRDGILRPFSHIQYWYHFVLADDSRFDTPKFSFDYIDNSHPWQVLRESNLAVFWYDGSLPFGQAALDSAHAGYLAVQGLVPPSGSDPIDIYIYPNAEDVQAALNLGGYTWVGGHASPDLGVVLVSIQPGETQAIEMQRQIPHELAHILLYRTAGAQYIDLPQWLVEGIATQAERIPNGGYAQVLANAQSNKILLPISSICGSFPSDAGGVTLAYAESNSFIRYLQQTFGNSGLQELISAYTDGLSCDEGAKRAFGYTLNQLDQSWRKAALGENITSMALQNFLPYLVILALALVVPAWRLMGVQKRQKYGSSSKPE